MLLHNGKIADDLLLVTKNGFHGRIREALSTVSKDDVEHAEELHGFTMHVTLTPS